MNDVAHDSKHRGVFFFLPDTVTYHFFPKKLMILPCPFLSGTFFPFEPEATDGLVFTGGAAGSSSENDSQAGSSIVTIFN